jgi:hypothetical protein
LRACWREREVPQTTLSVVLSIQLCAPTPSKSEMITTTGMCDRPARRSPLAMNLLVPVVKLQICARHADSRNVTSRNRSREVADLRAGSPNRPML